MKNFRNNKNKLQDIFYQNNWKNNIEKFIYELENIVLCISPLISYLNNPKFMWQAAYSLGVAVSKIAESDIEKARIVMRRFMWSMNEESGNIGWGIPEAMACVIASSNTLKNEYGRILLSYGLDSNRKEDNYIEHAPLRKGVIWGLGYVSKYDVDYAKNSLMACLNELLCEYSANRLCALWAVLQIAKSFDKNDNAKVYKKELLNNKALLALLESNNNFEITIFDGNDVVDVDCFSIVNEFNNLIKITNK